MLEPQVLEPCTLILSPRQCLRDQRGMSAGQLSDALPVVRRRAAGLQQNLNSQRPWELHQKTIRSIQNVTQECVFIFNSLQMIYSTHLPTQILTRMVISACEIQGDLRENRRLSQSCAASPRAGRSDPGPTDPQRWGAVIDGNHALWCCFFCFVLGYIGWETHRN